MKRLSITKKITIWYTIFLVLLATGFVVAISVMGNLKAGELTKSKLMDSVRDIGRYIERDGRKFFLDKKLKFYDEGVYLNFPFKSLKIAKLYLRTADYIMIKPCGIYEKILWQPWRFYILRE